MLLLSRYRPVRYLGYLRRLECNMTDHAWIQQTANKAERPTRSRSSPPKNPVFRNIDMCCTSASGVMLPSGINRVEEAHARVANVVHSDDAVSVTQRQCMLIMHGPRERARRHA